MRLRRKVHHGVNLLRLQNVHHQVGRQDVALDEFEVQVVLDGLQIVECRAVVQLVEDDHLVVLVFLDQIDGDVRANKPSASCDQHVLRLVIAHLRVIRCHRTRLGTRDWGPETGDPRLGTGDWGLEWQDGICNVPTRARV